MNGDYEIGRREGDDLRAFLRQIAGMAIAEEGDRDRGFIVYELVLSQPFDRKRASVWKEAFFNEWQRQANAARKARHA